MGDVIDYIPDIGGISLVQSDRDNVPSRNREGRDILHFRGVLGRATI